jgi:hypothetical protein
VADHSSVRFEGDLVLKWYSSDVTGEFAKANALWEVAQRSGFVFPEPLDLNEAESVITYRNLESQGDWEPVRKAYLDCMLGDDEDNEAAGVIAAAGRVLGAIHRELRLGDAEEWTPPIEFARSLERAGVGDERQWKAAEYVCLHADYGFSNVLWSKDTGTIATLDPSPDWYSTFAAGLRGPAYVDLGQFVSCLEGRVPLRYYPRIKWRRLDRLRDVFLDAYETEVGNTVDRDCVRSFGFAVAEANFQDRLSSKLSLSVARKVLYNRVKGNAF